MLALKPMTREEMRERWARIRPPDTERAKPPPRPLNLRHILDLGNVVYFTFRGRSYGVPPLPWRTGEELLDAWLQLREMGQLDERSKVQPYYKAMRRLQDLLWKSCRPVGKLRRLLDWLHLHRNPFRKATEGEIAELAVFLLGRRMSGLFRLPVDMNGQGRGT